MADTGRGPDFLPPPSPQFRPNGGPKGREKFFCHPYNNNNNNDNNNDNNKLSFYSVYITSCSRRFTILQKNIEIQINYNDRKKNGSNKDIKNKK